MGPVDMIGPMSDEGLAAQQFRCSACGNLTRFDVTVTNKGTWPLTLQRFALTDEYSNYDRDAGQRDKALAPPKEIAAVDLAGLELSPEKSHSFTFQATFPNAGERWIYFNALISGPTQNWDTHQAHELTVHGPK